MQSTALQNTALPDSGGRAAADRGRMPAKRLRMPASQWVFMLALLTTRPLGLVVLIPAVGGEDLQNRIAAAAAGAGSTAGGFAPAAR